MIKKESIYIPFFVLFLHSLNASSIEESQFLNEVEKEGEKEKNISDDFNVVKSNLFNAISELHNKITSNDKEAESIEPVIKSFSEFAQFLIDQKEKFKCCNDIAKLAGFIKDKIIAHYKEKEQAVIISNFIYNIASDLNVFSEKLYSVKQENEDVKSSFYDFLFDCLNKQEIDGVQIKVSLLLGKRPHFNINLNSKADKKTLSNLFVKIVLKDKDEVVQCTKWNGTIIKFDEKDNSISSLINKKKSSFAICFPKNLEPSAMHVIFYNREKEKEIIFSF